MIIQWMSATIFMFTMIYFIYQYVEELLSYLGVFLFKKIDIRRI